MQQTVSFFNSNPTLGNVLKLVFMIIVVAIVVSLVLKLEKRLIQRLLEKHNNLNMRFVDNIIRFVVILVAVQVVMMSSPLTSELGKLLFQGTAIIGAIAGFAAQPVIADLICGLILSATRPFELGDRIELNDGQAGIVIDITLRHVVLRGMDTERIVIPNSKLNGMQIHNMSIPGGLRSLVFRFNVSYTSDVDLARSVIHRAVEESPCAVPTLDTPSGKAYRPVYFLKYAESSLVLATTVYYTAEHPTEAVKSDINTRVKRALNEAGIEIPYNYINVVMDERREQA